MPQPSACPASVSEETKKKMGTNLGKGVKSIPSYVEKSDFVVIVAPGCLHADRRDSETKLRTKTCYRTYRKRGWCCLEFFGSYLSRDKDHPVLLITSNNGIPEWISSLDTLTLAVGTCDFTCCQRNHIFGDRVVPCDRGICHSILETMIAAKVQHFFNQGQHLQARLCTCLSNWWLRTNSDPEEHRSENLASFKSLLRWNDVHKEDGEWVDRDGVFILSYAVLRNDIERVREILSKSTRLKERVNDVVFENGFIEFGIPAKCTLEMITLTHVMYMTRTSYFF